MENNIKIRHPHSRLLKKGLRWNDSLKKYEKTIPLKQKQNMIQIQEHIENKKNLKHFREGLMEPKPKIKTKEDPSIYLSTTNYDREKINTPSFSSSRKNILKFPTPKENYYLRKEINIHHYTPTPSNRLNIKDDFNEKNARNNKNNDILSSSYMTSFRPESRASFRPNYNNKEFRYLRRSFTYIDNDINKYKLSKNYAGENIKYRKLSTLNNILKKQNKELRQKVIEMENKINHLLNEIKKMKIENQKVESGKKKLLEKIKNLENELNFNRTMRFKELKLKANTKNISNTDILNLNNLFDKKEKPIIELPNNMENYSDSYESRENYINKRNNKRINFYTKTDTYNDESNCEDDNENELIKQIYELREQTGKLKYEKESTKKGNKIMRKNLLVNDDRLCEHKKRIATLIEENKNFRDMNQKLKTEKQKMKNYYMSLLLEQKKSLENKFKNNFNDLGHKINMLRNENNALKIEIDNISCNNLFQSQDISDNNNMNSQLITQLKEENNMLKTQLNEKEKELNNNNNFNEGNNNENILREINYLKNNLEEKRKEINNLKENLKNLFNQLNSYKNSNKDLMNNNTQLKQEINQLNIKVNNLENENFSKEQQIKNLSNLNNKLSKLVNNANNDNCQQEFNNKDLNYNERLEQKISLLERKNEILQEHLKNKSNNEKINHDKINKIILEKNNLLKANCNLEKEILTLKFHIDELENVNNCNSLNLQRIDELERELKETKNECEINLNELKDKQNENQKLLNIIKNKEKENTHIKNEFENNYDGKSGIIDTGDNINTIFKEKIENLEKELDSCRTKNDKLFIENSTLKERMDSIKSEPDVKLLITIDKLKEELKNKNSEIKKLINENNYLRNSANNNNEEERDIDLNNNKNKKNSFGNNVNSSGFNDADRIKPLMDEIKNYQLESDSDKKQIKTLKEDIKLMKGKIKDLETFGGQMKDMNEFFSLLNKALLNYKPKKKEQKEALNKIMVVLNNSQK